MLIEVNRKQNFEDNTIMRMILAEFASVLGEELVKEVGIEL